MGSRARFVAVALGLGRLASASEGPTELALEDDRGCGPASASLVLGPPDARRPRDAGPGAVTAAGTARMRFGDGRGELVADAFVVRGEAHSSLWLQLERDGHYLSAVYTLTDGMRGTGTFSYSVVGDCVPVGRICQCIAASRIGPVAPPPPLVP